ncbi:ubiquitin-specific protease ubp2 [Blastocladiella emersonii ATCC 22665]|nr:ubiquitin-specific protease ubp2 [Blastocladiella emersonii ATCC 22665]
MEKGDAELLQQLFAENNELRARAHVQNRELFSKSLQLESLEDEVRTLRSQRDSDKAAKAMAAKKTTGGGLGGNVTTSAAKDLEDAMYTIDRKNNEIRQLKEELKQLQMDLENQEAANDRLEGELSDLQTEFDVFRASRETVKVERLEVAKSVVDTNVSKQIAQFKELLSESESIIERQKRQIQDISTEASRKYSEQQTQMQGLESLVEQVKQQYEEFIQVSKIENDAYRQQQAGEYAALKLAFEAHKKEQYDEKRAMMVEHHAMLFTLQTLFDEYRRTCEFLFNTESSKLEDELINQSLRYEHEILYIIQAKDKFYSDMMVSKDAKIMNLIEGSDLTSLLQKHELDIENVRKEYTLELERIKTQQESEQKHVISLLQRQNATLEGKAEKLSSHIKTLEGKIKDLLVAIESKNKALAERDEQRLDLELKHAAQLDQERLRYAQVMQEKEFLRHKVIRLNMESKGTGENTVENMLKRISRETSEVARNYGELAQQHEELLDTNGKLERQIREREKWIEFLENEVAKRNDEFKLMVATFEEFLAQRSKQARRDRARRLQRLMEDKSSGGAGRADGTQQPATAAAALDLTVQPVMHQTVRIRVPDVVTRMRANEFETLTIERQEMDRAQSYLKRFKTMSRAFATGELKKLGGNGDSGTTGDLLEPPGPRYNEDGVVGGSTSPQGQRVSLYKEHEDDAVLTAAQRVYQAEREVAAAAAAASSSSAPGTPSSGGPAPLKMYGYEMQLKSTIAEVETGGAQGAMIGAFRGTKKGPLAPPGAPPAALASGKKGTTVSPTKRASSLLVRGGRG